MNAYPLSQYHGLQVWYSPNNPQSQMLAESVRSMISGTLQKENDRQCKRATSSIYLLHHLEMPAILVECGFLSNPEEAALLANEDYQRTLARLLFLAIMEYQT
jgi:N-acetylmuramoyl-L-alanine amidase